MTIGLNRIILGNPAELVRRCPEGFSSTSSIICGGQRIPVINLTKERKALFNSISTKLGNEYYKDTIDTRFNIFLTKKQRETMQKDVDNNFLSNLMRETKDIFVPELSFEASKIMQNSVREALNDLNDVFEIPESIAYVEAAKRLGGMKIRLSNLEDEISEKAEILKELKQKYNDLTDAKEKEEAAKKYNDMADIYNEVIAKYNSLLTGDYADQTRKQMVRRQQIKNEFRDKTLFYMLYGHYDPKMPIMTRKGN